MLYNQCLAEFAQLYTELWNKLGSHEVFDWLFGGSIGVGFDIELGAITFSDAAKRKIFSFTEDWVGTYNKLIFFRVMSDFGNVDRTRNGLIVLSLAYKSG
jgi:hypothetical protein